MIVRPFDNPLRFHVVSDSQREIEHLVDLAENGTFGKCSCQHFEFRLQPALDQGITPDASERCKHLKAARDHLCDQVIARLK